MDLIQRLIDTDGIAIDERHARIILALAPKRKDNGTACWPIKTKRTIAEDIHMPPKKLSALFYQLERMGVIASSEKDAVTAQLLWRLTKTGQRMLTEAATKKEAVA